VNPEIEAPERAAYADAFRASPELCELAEIGGATCFALRRAPERTFCRVMGLRSTEPLDEIAAFYGDTPGGCRTRTASPPSSRHAASRETTAG
jgi:hypothetical protein